MALVSPRILVPISAVVIVWGAAQFLGSHSAVVSPAVWPIVAATPAPFAPAPGTLAVPTPDAPAPATGGIPFLPGALQQLNGATGNTAVGIYALVQQLEAALSSRLEQLSHQLEPGR